MITPVDPERNVGERAPRYRGDSSSPFLEPERQAVRELIVLRTTTRPRAARGDGTCADLRCRHRGHGPVAARSTTGRHGSRRIRGRRIMCGPLAIGANEERSALVIVTGALNVLVGGAAATSHREEVARKARPRGIPGPSVVRRLRLASCRTARTSAWSLVQLPRVASGRLERCPIGCDPHQPSRVEGASCCCLQDEQLEAWSTWTLESTWKVAIKRH